MAVYLNNGATSWPKPLSVAEAMFRFVTDGGASLARGGASKKDMDTFSLVVECRQLLSCMFGGWEKAHPCYVTFTSNVSESLNVVLKGTLEPGMTVITTSMEHNSVIRPLSSLQKQGVTVKVLFCDMQGYLQVDHLSKALEEGAHLCVLSHASNLCGSVQDLPTIAQLCSSHGVDLVVDAAQTAGHLPLDAEKLNLAALCFTGHKGLMGPQGIGGILWRPDFASQCRPLLEGGTGSFSDEEEQPHAMPDRFETGTPNLPGIAGLKAALEWIDKIGFEEIHRQEMSIGARLLEGLKALKGIRIYGSQTMERRLPVFAMNFEAVDNAELAAELSLRGVDSRPGLHCTPWGHQTVGTFPEGALRLSPGYFTTEEEVDEALAMLSDSLEALRR